MPGSKEWSVAFTGLLNTVRVHMQIDIGFGDVVTPGPERFIYPTLLDFPAPILSGYSLETVMAEKLQAHVQLRILNTRMKDYFDLWLLSQQPELNRETLATAIERTFSNRKIEIDKTLLDFPLNLATIRPSRCNEGFSETLRTYRGTR
ncbi:nucleotidyl transferase AbiEii/AbiGii toxin family protein [Edaphobacter sp. 12200R-103]|jgi:hypothetical protein|uniref:nucleotidyl transferase AbiEii/AbiGii toxin family protein n=1 Tax=Edaphobacter sp. 12200R-103 TaxID=2703788 RepID=UPI00138B3650|nr:nucleotidyl transferase AbiEii/AbiGii toxin family protein [Edaphobacter sp. 12200R-103]QHS50415.1 nucleotidyl transferase AbiEii/AbiGii toxin family protein [Edaphobacter sp. 12200R-103]